MHVINKSFNKVFQKKTLVIKILNVGGRVGVNNSFAGHNSTTVRNILMI